MTAAAWGFERYLRGQARRHFTGVHWLVQGDPWRWDRTLPTVFVANHTNWWDGFLAFLATRTLGLEFRVLMEAQHLARYPFFLRVGALPLRRGPARAAYRDLTAALPHLGPGVGLWVFPQGLRRPPQEPVARCERGAAHLVLAHRAPVRVCPVAFRYSFLGEQLPEVFVLVGPAWVVRPGDEADRGSRMRVARMRATLMRAIAARLAGTVDALDARVRVEAVGEFRPLVRGQLSVNKRLDRVRHALGLLRGPFESRNG